MGKFTGYLLVIYAIACTGFAAYEYAVIDRLNWVISVLMSGSPH